MLQGGSAVSPRDAADRRRRGAADRRQRRGRGHRPARARTRRGSTRWPTRSSSTRRSTSPRPTSSPGSRRQRLRDRDKVGEKAVRPLEPAQMAGEVDALARSAKASTAVSTSSSSPEPALVERVDVGLEIGRDGVAGWDGLELQQRGAARADVWRMYIQSGGSPSRGIDLVDRLLAVAHAAGAATSSCRDNLRTRARSRIS